jgi:hypothetical protein
MDRQRPSAKSARRIRFCRSNFSSRLGLVWMQMDVNSHGRNALMARVLGAVNLTRCKAAIREAVIAAADIVGCVCAIGFSSCGGRNRLSGQMKTSGRFVLTSAQLNL